MLEQDFLQELPILLPNQQRKTTEGDRCFEKWGAIIIKLLLLKHCV